MSKPNIPVIYVIKQPVDPSLPVYDGGFIPHTLAVNENECISNFIMGYFPTEFNGMQTTEMIQQIWKMHTNKGFSCQEFKVELSAPALGSVDTEEG